MSTTPSPSAAEKPHSPLCVLVVDDFRDTANSLAQLLNMLGHEAHATYDGRTALLKAATLRPHVVLLDLNLAGADGCDVARALRESGLREALLIAATGSGREEDRQCCAQAGFDHFMVKPLDLVELQSLLDRKAGRRVIRVEAAAREQGEPTGRNLRRPL